MMRAMRLSPFRSKLSIIFEDSTIDDAGKVGVWTKADSVTHFNDFSYGTGE